MRRAKKSGGASLDSLLDTMTNVVGILVILLTVTQLGVGDAVKRISTTDSVKPEALEEARLKLAEVQKVRDELLRRLKAMEQNADEDPAKELERLLKQIAEEEAQVAALKEKLGLSEVATEDQLRQHFQELRQAMEAHQEKEKQLLTKINTTEDELDTLRAQLAQTPDLGPPPAKIINLPNPRTAPEGTTPLTFLCREGRVIPVDEDVCQDRALKRAVYLVNRKKLDGGPQAGVDGKRLAEEFNDQKLRDDDGNFDLQLSIPGRVPRLVFKRREGAGEDVDEIQRTSSRYQQKIRRIDPRRHYLQFQVWPDGFEAYLEARKIADQRGLLAGWIAQTTGGEYSVNLEGEIRCGPPPPKPPPPKPLKPGETPPPKPPPRPVPKDVID